MKQRENRKIVAGFQIALCLAGAAVLVGACASASLPASPLPPANTAAAGDAGPRPTAPVLGSFDPAEVAGIRLLDTPVVPVVSASARMIYQAGLARGNNPRVFSKLGDCMTETSYFLTPFSLGAYELGEYQHLRGVIEHFARTPARSASSDGWEQDSFATPSLAAASGFNVAGPLDPTWANPEWCQAGESPLACEYRVARPSIALIMFGTNDTTYTEPAAYDYYLRTIVLQTLERDILPVLSTFPTRPENPDKSLLLNQIVIRVASDYDIPLLNLNRALEPLPHHGVNPDDTLRLLAPPDERVDIFDEAHLQAGFTVRNLVTLQALAAVLAAVQE